MSVILMVEDEILEQEFLKSIILKNITQRDTLLTCQSGVQAIKLAHQYRPEIIIMDILIPELNGLSTIEEIRKFLPKSSVIILSASSEFYYAQKAIRLQVLDYLLKPVKPSVFKEVLSKALSSIDEIPIGTQETAKKEFKIQHEFQNSCIIESIDYIKDHFMEKLTLEKISSKVFVHPKYFSHIFKKEVGISFSEYVINLRIQHACQLLKNTKYPAYRISSECGFSDASYFNKVFCTHMNMTPHAYRKTAYKSMLKD